MENIFNQIDQLQKEINRLRPLDKELLKQIKAYYRVGLTYSSNALEGNSLTETETKIVLEDGITISGKPLKDHYEAVGHSEAYDFLYTLSRKKAVGEADLKEFHRLFYRKIDEPRAGVYRKNRVIITGSKYPLPGPKDVAALMKGFVRRMPAERKKRHAVGFSAWAHKEFVFIHPFVDGNGRVARLLMNLILLQEGFVMALIPPVLRNEYIQFLEKAHTDDGEFIAFIARTVLQTQQDYLRLLKP